MKFHFEGLDVPITLPDNYLSVRMYENLQGNRKFRLRSSRDVR
jgi:hypothetical protein